MHLSEAKHVLQSFGFLVLLRLQLEPVPATDGRHYPVLPPSLWPHLCSFQLLYRQEGTQRLRLRGLRIRPPEVRVGTLQTEFKATRRWGGGRWITTHRGRIRGSRKYFWANSSNVLDGSTTASSPLSAERVMTGGPCGTGAVAKDPIPSPIPLLKLTSQSQVWTLQACPIHHLC